MTKRLKIRFFLAVLIGAIILQSCNKWLDLKPQDGLTADEYWKTKEQLDGAVMGCYASMLGLPKYLFMWGELRGDMVIAGLDPANEQEFASLSTQKQDEVNMLRSDILSTNSIADWAGFYQTINYCNNVIKSGPTVRKNDPTLTEQQLNSYMAEAYGIRGLMYFYLLRTFGEVPLKLEPTISDADVKPIAKSTKEEVYSQIVKDLLFATENAVGGYSTIAEEKGRVNKYVAYTILADVYLWGEEYQKSIDACDKVIKSNKYFIFPKFTSREEYFQSVFSTGNSAEGVFELQYGSLLNPFYNMFVNSREFAAADWVAQGGLFGFDPTSSNANDIRGNGTSINDANAGIIKFTGAKTSATSNSHWFIYRYSDVLLMKAEALNWLSPGTEVNTNAALDLVDEIRSRRNALPVVGDVAVERPVASDYERASEYIMEERAREFAYEGKRWFDILRNAKRNNYKNEDILLDIVVSSAPANKQETVRNKYRDHRSHYLPIYYYEIQTNKDLVQNPFYQ